MHWVIAAILGWDLVVGPHGFAFLFLWIACVFFSVLVHEMGHVLMGRFFGSDGHILLYSFGGVAIGSSDLNRRWQRILVYFAGPLAQFVLLALMIASSIFLVPLISKPAQTYVAGAHSMLFLINLFWPVLNLLPIWPLDGGKICRDTLEGFFGHMGVVISLVISMAVAGLLAFQVLMNALGKSFVPYGWIVGSGWWMAIFFVLFCVSSFQALQIENSRRTRWDDELPWER
jgi:Zn-dependent protease